LATALLVVASALFLLCPPPTAMTQTLQSEPSWTVMVYMANDFSVTLPWQENVNSMEAAPQAEGVNVIVLIDNEENGDSVLLRIEHDEAGATGAAVVSTEVDDGGAVVPVSGEVDMANPATLTDFVVFCADEFPADRLVLVLWGHGAGWYGLCPDGSDLLTLPEVGDALQDAMTDMGRRLDVTVVDACAEATLEMIAQIRPYSDYFVAAQNAVPYQGLPYEDILGSLAEDKGQSVEEFCSAIVSLYVEYSWYVSPYSATMAAFDLDEMGTVLSLLDLLSAQGIKYGSIFHDVINDALSDAEYYDTEWYVDLVDLLTVIHESDLPLEVRILALETAIAFRESTISFQKYDHPDPHDGIHVEHANGAVIFVPSTSPYEAEYCSLALSVSGTWDEFAMLARTVMAPGPIEPGPTLAYSDSDDDGLDDTALLAWEPAYPIVEVWVYSRLPNGILFIASETSTSSTVSIHGPVGDLVIAASAVNTDGEAVSYSTVNATLFAVMELRIVFLADGQTSGDRYDVQIVSSTYSGYALREGGAQVARLTIPTQAAVGEMVLVRVMSGQDVLLEMRHAVSGQDTVLAVDIHESGRDAPLEDIVLLLFSLLPAVLVGLFAVLLYIDHRRHGDKKG